MKHQQEKQGALLGDPGWWWGRQSKTFSLSLLLSLPLLLSFLRLSTLQVPHAQVPDVQPVCPNEAPLSRIWMAPDHPPGISVHEGTAAIQH